MNGLLQESLRGAIVTGIRAGRTNREIADFNNISYNTVKNFSREYYNFIEEGGQDEEFDIKRKKHRRHSDAHSMEIVERVQEAINDDTGRSMRQMAVELEVSEWLIRKIVKEDIRYRSYSLRRGQFMSAATKKICYEKAAALLNRLKHPPEPDILIFFSDEKNFSQDQKVNSRNHRWLYDDPSEVPIVMKTKFPATVMVLGVVSNKGDVMPPHAGLRVNTEVYINVLTNVVKPWMDRVAAGRPYIWQQDGAPAHTSKKTQDWCRENLPFLWEKEVWPSSSPDCNPMDNFVWGVSERDVNRSPHNTKLSLINTIMEMFSHFSREDIQRACSTKSPKFLGCIYSSF
jgi:transposase